MICAKCGKVMIKRCEENTAMYPARYTIADEWILMDTPLQLPFFWWCGCGHREDGGIDHGKSGDEIYKRLWKQANGLNE